MTWLWVILIVAAISGIIGYISTEDKRDRGETGLGCALTGGMGCGYIIFQIFLFLVGLFILFKIGSWLFS